ncbi:MAG TPA: hypothetical protein PKJ99_16285 [Thermoanaerobaculales bacterium]|nr:hypothetical protein [Thermoanaerobaculales bacterium]HPA80713.1 hypothetical protein [Thermoanaerobaculales bacterium]HQL29248.1 hypothetical protein [Thermoanaerobaculales bacterium]HQN96190.1 hypothetical protein [Thermoanaerobaculales bacterium]HQP43415.1 hypothetical protein [Thermoanaerobaculales bacterium]
MSQHKVSCVAVMGLAVVLLAVATPAAAQREYEPLFDKFNLRLEGSWMGISTEMRLDSELSDRGTTLNFEDDLDLEGSQTIPSVAFEWQIAKRHKLGVRWQDVSRDATAATLEEIHWGDEVIPVNADVSLGFDTSQYYIDYAYFPWVKEQWAAGFGLGVRWIDISATLAWQTQGGSGGEGSTDTQGSGPLPYLYFEYRRLLGDDWRLFAGLGWLGVEVGDIDGSQYIGKLGIEYLLGRHWGFGVAGNYSAIDVDWKGLETDQVGHLYNGTFNLDVNDVSIFARYRF